MQEKEVISGYITHVYKGKGYGFIMTEQSESLFFHATALVNDEIENLIVGQQADFIVIPGKNDRLQAGMIRITEGE